MPRQGVFLPELQALYSALRGGRAPELPPLEVTYADYSAWQRERLDGGQLAKSIEYWKVGCRRAPHSSCMYISHLVSHMQQICASSRSLM